jgi:hypothetical protein
MPLPRSRSLPTSLLVLAFLAGAAAVGFGRWVRPALDGDRAVDAGNSGAALQHYAAAENRIARFGVTRQLAGAEQSRVVANQLHLLYLAGRYDDVVEKASAAPSGAVPHFWAGTALLTRALSEPSGESRLVWASRAEEELKLALQAAPDDWDTKVNYELAARWTAELRANPKKKADPSMQILRPQPRQPLPTRKSG